jgi:uncharacterized phage-associated protein
MGGKMAESAIGSETGFDTFAVANAFLELGDHDPNNWPPITPMKLQKLVYFAYGWYLAMTKGRRLTDSVIEAWDYGPVIRTLYKHFKQFGAEPIHGRATRSGRVPALPNDRDGLLAREVITFVWDLYGRYTGIELSNMTHVTDAPWTRTRAQFPSGAVPAGKDIDDATIRDYFERLLEDARTF